MSASVVLKDSRRGTLAMLALACGVMVANIYLCQPLLAEMARAFGVSPERAALVSVATQVGYTLGILLVVPLADSSNPVKLIRRMMLLTIAGLLAAAAAPALGVLLLASVSIAATCVVAQILIPMATTLAAPEYRGRIVSKLSTGLILGILLSRTFSGLAAEYLGSWRAPFLIEALLVSVLFFVLPGFLPQRTTSAGMGYWALLKSLPPLLRHRELQLSMALSFCCFAGFSALWATLAFHLASPAFGMGPAAAGLFGLWGAPGALLAPMAGRLADRWGPARVNAFALTSMAGCFVLAATYGQASIVALVIAVNLLDFGMQGGQVANQTRIFGLSADIRGRLNTLYMVVTFGGGAAGALAGGWAWSVAGWVGICWLGGVLVLIAALILALSAAFTSVTSRTAAAK